MPTETKELVTLMLEKSVIEHNNQKGKLLMVLFVFLNRARH